MDALIDLKELSIRESERVEWKENGDDIQIVKSIVKTISAFANDISNLGGGYVVCGAKEVKDEYGFPQIEYSGLTASKLKEIEGKIIQHCRDYVNPSVLPRVHELENPMDSSTRILVFVVSATAEAHVYRDGTTTNYYVRMSRETREARNGILLQLFTQKSKMEPFDKRVNLHATRDDIDIFVFRAMMRELKLPANDTSLDMYFSDTEQIATLIPALFVRTKIDDVLRPRNFALLLFGKITSITRWYIECFTIISIYRGTDRSEPTAERYELVGTIIEQAKTAIALLSKQVYTAFDKESNNANQLNYPMRAVEEAVVNAIIHRDYEIHTPIRITVFSDRIEISSPGSLYMGVDKEKFLKGVARPKWRNQSFAYLFNKLKLTQSEGQGIPTIFRTMRNEGCPEPIFEIDSESVTCILPAHPRHQLIRELQEIRDKMFLENYDEALKQLIPLLNNDLYNIRMLNLYCEIISKLKQPEILFNFLTDKKVVFQNLRSNTLRSMAEILMQGTAQHRRLARQILKILVQK
jgi:predicted HTH transcriptional regulator